ncbi:MAG: fold metallo-hydrolase [Panacagrimonas sp.]|nr:MBL fold metallo-hydrolase [Panacagrimonas sp.]MCC2655086.1 fold metallo-hydrolase [Panacagrimonas sp.]
MSLRIHHLNCGTMCPYGRRLMAGEGGIFETSEMCCHCLLIETAQGLVLVDSGLGTDDVRTPARLGGPFRAVVRPQLRMEETALAQVQRLGFKREDVRHIVLTHLDLDHAGGIADFPDAKVHVFNAEIEAAMAPSLREKMRYVQAQWAHGPHWVGHRTEGERWFGFDAVRAIANVEPEVLLVPLTGHTRGHCGVAVRDAGRWMLHCGDAYFYRGEVETPARCPIGLMAFQSIMQINGPQRLHNQRRLRELNTAHGGEVALFCAHDPLELSRQRAAA